MERNSKAVQAIADIGEMLASESEKLPVIEKDLEHLLALQRVDAARKIPTAVMIYSAARELKVYLEIRIEHLVDAKRQEREETINLVAKLASELDLAIAQTRYPDPRPMVGPGRGEVS